MNMVMQQRKAEKVEGKDLMAVLLSSNLTKMEKLLKTNLYNAYRKHLEDARR